MEFVQQKNVVRAPSLKRGKIEERISDRVKLEKVLGVTVSSNAALDSNPGSDLVAYPAGCTVVLFNTQTGRQNHIINSSRKSITSLAFSSCGRYLVTGECGHQPAVRVWDLQSDPTSTQPGLYPQYQQVAEHFSHKYGICCVAFSPSNKFVVSVGTQHDMVVNVWEWRANVKAASNKVSTKVKALAFSEGGGHFVTVGNRHVKFWFLESGGPGAAGSGGPGGGVPGAGGRYAEAVPLTGRSAILGVQRNNYFCDVACGRRRRQDSTYAITRSGLLCEFNCRRLLDKWVELRTTSANCIVVGEKFIFVGCAEGIVRCFDPLTLHFVTTLPRTHYLGVDVSSGHVIQHMSSPPPEAKYPDAIAIAYDETNDKLTCIYNDHSIYVWDVHNVKQVGKSHSFLYHSACIWGVEMAPPNRSLPPGSFLSCSSDDTIRLWTLDKINNSNHSESSSTYNNNYRKNIYSDELLKIVYVGDDLAYLKDANVSNVTAEKAESSYDGRNGVRCVKLSPDGKHLASGDRAGNVRIHDTSTMRELLKIEAHDAEVLCLEYSSPEHSDRKLLASASRDRLIHVFDVERDYDFVQTLDDHSSSITAVRFLGAAEPQPTLRMASCGADKCVMFRSLRAGQFARDHNASSKATLYDMEVDHRMKHVLTACQDRNVRVYGVATGKHKKCFKGSTGDDGTLIKLALDQSGIYLATSCTDKSLSVYDYYTGECMATMCGHSELATGLRFTNDCRRLISASGDGCIFVWRVPHDMVVTMHARLSQQAMRQGRVLDSDVFSDGVSGGDSYEAAVSADVNYRFSVGQLPLWARKQMPDPNPSPSPPGCSYPSVKIAVPKGRWAQRAEIGGGVPFYPEGLDLQGDDGCGSKDSSLDSGADTRHPRHPHPRDQRSPPIAASSDSALGSLRGDADAAHDADVDSDVEPRAPPPPQVYYPAQQPEAAGAEFTVTNIDADELRRSTRRARRPPLAVNVVNQQQQQQQQPTSISGSQESDDDDDEASTPSGDNTDRNPLSSFLSASSESLDRLASRERFLHATFESLEAGGAEPERARRAAPAPDGKASLSARHHHHGGAWPPPSAAPPTTAAAASATLRNASVIDAARRAKTDMETTRRREELNRMIADTKKKLANVGHNSPLKYSKSTHDLLHIPEKEKWSPDRSINQGISSSEIPPNASDFPYSINDTDTPCDCLYLTTTTTNELPRTNDFLTSPTLSDVLNKSPERCVKNLAAMIRPRKLQLDRTLVKYKTHKSLPVSPVNEEMSFSDFARNDNVENFELTTRRSFSYFVDFKDETNRGFREICQDIEKFSQEYLKGTDDEGNFSSDSLEECSYGSSKNKKKDLVPPRRCVSNNEIYKYQETQSYSEFYHHNCEIPKSNSFYLNPSNKNSQDSILSEELYNNKSYCNSLESVLSNDSDCKSAPLEVLFSSYRKLRSISKNEDSSNLKRSHTFTVTEFDRKSVETQTEEKFITRRSSDFQKKLEKFENITKQKGVAFFVDTKIKPDSMHIPSLESKNKQYKSKYRNVLNNKPEFDCEIFESGRKPTNQFTLTNLNFERNRNQIQETSSLDRHLLSNAEKVCHKPPKAVRRHSSKTRKKTYEYIKKEDFYKNNNNKKNNLEIGNENVAPSRESTIQFNYKEKNIDRDCENGNLLTELYDSLDKPSSSILKMDLDSLEVVDSFESKNLWTEDKDKPEKDKLNLNTINRIQSALENIKILNEIQRKIRTINDLVDVFKRNISKGKVKAISSMYERLAVTGTDTGMEKPRPCRRRNLSLPNFIERRLNYECVERKPDKVEVDVDLDSSLRRACSLSDLSMQWPPAAGSLQSKHKLETALPSSKCQKNASRSAAGSRFARPQPVTKSNSTSALNHGSDSEDPDAAGGAFRKPTPTSRLMRPTISSLNKLANATVATGTAKQSSNVMARKRHTQSVMNLSTVGMSDSSTTDEEGQQKPTVPPRARNAPNVRKAGVAKEPSSSSKAPPVARKKSASAGKVDVVDLDRTLTAIDVDPSDALDVSTVQFSTQLCEDVARQLTRAAHNASELYRRLAATADPSELANPDRPDSNINDRSDAGARKSPGAMRRVLELSMARTQAVLQEALVARRAPAATVLRNGNANANGNGNDAYDSERSQVEVLRAMREAVARGRPDDQDALVRVMRQYLDVLLSMMQHKIQRE